MKPGKNKGLLPIKIQEAKSDSRMTANGGLFTVFEMYRALGLEKVVTRYVQTKQRRRGFTDAQMVESFIALFVGGGECLADFERFRQDKVMTEIRKHSFPSASCARDWLNTFHSDEHIEAARQQAVQLQFLSFVPEETDLLRGLELVNRHVVAAGQVKQIETTATLDIDATVAESHKQTAQCTYLGIPGYQPTVALWAEKDLIVADEFRDGNVPAEKDVVRVLKAAAAALPATVNKILVRADSASYNHEFLGHCRKMKYQFGVSADMSPQLLGAVCQLPEDAWQTMCDEGDVLRQWAELPYAPSWPYESKDDKPDRYVAIRVIKKQGVLFADGSDRKHFAVVSNRWKMKGDKLLEWHRGKAGTIELTHDVVKNDLAAGVLPCKRFGANAAWFRLNVLTYNILSLMRRHVFPEALRVARLKRLRFLVFSVGAELIHHARQLIYRLCQAYYKSFRWKIIRRNILQFAELMQT